MVTVDKNSKFITETVAEFERRLLPRDKINMLTFKFTFKFFFSQMFYLNFIQIKFDNRKECLTVHDK